MPTRPADTLGTARWQGCGYVDPGHGWKSGRAQLRNGFMGQGSGNDVFALTYYQRGQLPFIHEAVRRYTVYDRYFTSVLGPTFPNRYYKWAATSAGKTSNIDQVDVNKGGNQFETIFDRAIGRGAERALLPLRPAVRGGLRPTRRRLVEPDLALLRRLRGRHAAQHHDRRPAVPRRRRRRRPVGRRPPAGRRPAGPGVHGRRGQRLRQARPTTAAARCSSSTTSGAASSTTCARRACRTSAPPPTWTPTSARWASASRRWPSRRTRAGRPRTGPTTGWTTASTATSRSSS